MKKLVPWSLETDLGRNSASATYGLSDNLPLQTSFYYLQNGDNDVMVDMSHLL